MNEVSVRCTLAGLLAFGLALGCDSEEQVAAPQAPKVTVALVTRSDVPLAFKFAGTLTAVRSIDVIPRVTGRLDQRNFEEGAIVKEGDLLYVIDPRPMEAQLEAERARLGRDRARLEFVEKEADRFESLFDQGVGSREAADERESGAKALRATTELDSANVHDAELALEYTHINAPFTGRVERTQAHEGQMVTAEETVLTHLVQMDPIHATFNIGRADLALIRELLPGGLDKSNLGQYQATLVLDGAEAHPAVGRLDFLSAEINPATDTLPARAVFPNRALPASSELLVPGEYVQVELVVGQQADAVLVPQRAVVEDQTGRHVWVVDARDVVSRRPVTVGRAVGDRYVVEQGLEAGERTVINGLEKVRGGIAVEPTKAKPSPGSN